MNWVNIQQDSADYYPVMVSNKAKNLFQGIIFLKKKGAFDIFLKFKGSDAQNKSGKIFVLAPFKINRSFFSIENDSIIFKPGHGIAALGPYEHLHIMENDFHYLNPKRCHGYNSLREFACQWHINSIQIGPLEMQGPIESFPYRTIPLILWQDLNGDSLQQRSEQARLLIVFPK